jgi:hypothetical protein
MIAKCGCEISDGDKAGAERDALALALAFASVH